MKSSFSPASRLARGVVLSGLFCLALAASTAQACPPGTMPDPNYSPSNATARARPQRCVPAPKQPTAKYIGTNNPDVEHSARLHSQTPMLQDHSKVKPEPGAPIETANGGANERAIIFVGGKSALNPQPIPPGHTPQPSGPIEKH
ncbi:hypothetical protein [Rudaea sp.]|uniref:hypothetical protein n=1 Tax=Rudaea sp. TaxID=2136325 RepID=UPI00321F960B